MNDGCPRAWEVEAAHDGRVSGTALLALRQHVQNCGHCKREETYLRSLGEALRDQPSANEELSARRLRSATLARARAPQTSRRPWLVLVLPLMAAGAIALIGFGWRKTPTSAVTIRALSPHAKWTRQVRDGVEYVDVASGEVSFHVDHHPGDLKLVVRVPDGQIDDLGTVFALNAQAGRTVRIAVSEGVVLFRRGDVPSVAIAAGEIWRADATSDDATPQTECAALQPPTPVAPAETAAAPNPPKHRPRSVPPLTAAAPARTAVDLSVAFDRSAAEDAAYLRIIALVREGRSEEARLSARHYLSNFPGGFRRPEAERVAALP